MITVSSQYDRLSDADTKAIVYAVNVEQNYCVVFPDNTFIAVNHYPRPDYVVTEHKGYFTVGTIVKEPQSNVNMD